MNRRAAAAALAAAALAGCSGLWLPQRIVLSEDELQRQLARRFPMQRSLLDRFELQLDEPVLRLDAAANRLSTELRLQGSDRRSGRSLQGRLALDYALRFEPADGSIRLVRPRIQSLQFGDDSLPARRAELLQGMGVALAERVLDDMTLYRLGPDRLAALQRAGLRPGALQVTAEGLEITLEPIPAPGATAVSR